VKPSVGRTHAFDGSPGTVSQGLREAGTAQRNAPGELFALSLSCVARKAGDLPSWQILLVACDEPCFARSGKQTSFHLRCATRYSMLVIAADGGKL
jgi:hypothetical protein